MWADIIQSVQGIRILRDLSSFKKETGPSVRLLPTGILVPPTVIIGKVEY